MSRALALRIPFVAVNCAAPLRICWKQSCSARKRGMSRGGHAAGGGVFEQAHHGDSVAGRDLGNFPWACSQVATRLADREFQRVGSSETVKVDVRIGRGFDADLPAKIRKGRIPRGPLTTRCVSCLFTPSLATTS